MKITIITPTYNEKENIERTIRSLEKVFNRVPSHNMHILVADANSPDGTADIVRRLIKELPNVHLIVEKEKRGLGAAYKDAMEYAFNKMDSDAVITFDADLSHDENILPEMISKLEDGYESVRGSRYIKGGGIPDNWGVHRKLLSFMGNLFVRVLYFGSGIKDATSGYKAITKNVYDEIGDKIGTHGGYTFAIATNIEPYRAGFKAAEVAYKFKDRAAGESKMGPEYFIQALIFVVKARIYDFINSRFGKVFFAGGMGAVSQLLTYTFIFYPLIEVSNIFNLPERTQILDIAYLNDIHPKLLISQLLAIEVGVFVSFIVNNTWAFADSKLKGWLFLRRFAKNHLVVTGAIIIQLVIAQVLAFIFGIGLILSLIYQVIGILIGLIWNFYFYKKIIWKVKK